MLFHRITDNSAMAWPAGKTRQNKERKEKMKKTRRKTRKTRKDSRSQYNIMRQSRNYSLSNSTPAIHSNATYCIVLYCTFGRTHTHTHTKTHTHTHTTQHTNKHIHTHTH